MGLLHVWAGKVKARYRAAFWAFAVIAGAIQAWRYRFFIGPDGLNYLDVASAYLRHDWPMAVNSYWSPLYSWLLAGMLYLFHPSPYWESTALHALNFVIFLAALRAGEFLIQELMPVVKVPPWTFWTIGYCLLISTSLFMVPVYQDTPDLLMAALVYLAAGLLLRIRSGNAELWTYVLFGAVLGMAYLAKTIMFPVAFAFIIAARRRTLITIACFAAVCLPWIVVLSHSVHRITYGDAGTVNYAVYVNHSGVPIHPTHTFGMVREFASPIRATYPPWFNSYWREGIQPRFSFRSQAAALAVTSREYLHIMYDQKEFIAAWLILLLVGQRFYWRSPILLPALAALGLYAVIGHVEPRLAGAFLVLLWLALFAGIRVRSPRLLLCVSLALVSVTAYRALTKPELAARITTSADWQMADTLHKMGLRRGVRVALFGKSQQSDYWARLAGVEIAADIPEEAMPEYWSASPEVRRDIREQLSLLGIQTVVVEGPTRRGVLASALPED